MTAAQHILSVELGDRPLHLSLRPGHLSPPAQQVPRHPPWRRGLYDIRVARVERHRRMVAPLDGAVPPQRSDIV